MAPPSSMQNHGQQQTMVDVQPQTADKCILWALPDELIVSIIAQVEAHQDLCSFSVTCRKLQGMVEPFVWRSLLVLTGTHANHIATAMQARPERASACHEIAIRYEEKHENGIEELNPVLIDMHQLRHLMIESPCPNNHGGWRRGVSTFPHWTRIDYAGLFNLALNREMEFPPLPMLQSVSLHGHRNNFEPFLFGSTAVIFLHPTLRHLTISCTDFDAPLNLDGIPPHLLKSTKLESLKFIECNVYLSLLDVALSLPKALKVLEIGERLHAWEGCFPDHDKPRTSDPQFLDILQKQADSLERLVYITGNPHYATKVSGDVDGPEKLRNLTKLKYLELGTESHMMTYLLNGGYPDSLETIRLNDAAMNQFVLGMLDLTLSIRHIVGVAHKTVVESTPKAINVELLLTAGRSVLDAFDRWWSGTSIQNQGNRLEVYKLSANLKARGARLRIQAQMFSGSLTFIPPFMYGEELPHEELVYDSQAFWRFSGQDYQRYDENVLPAELMSKLRSSQEAAASASREIVSG